MENYMEYVKENWKKLALWVALVVAGLLSGLGVSESIHYANTEKPAMVDCDCKDCDCEDGVCPDCPKE